MHRYLNYLAGAWCDSDSPRLDVENPSTGELIGTVPDSSAADIGTAVGAAARAFRDGPWARLAVTARAQVLRDLATALEGRFDSLADGLVWGRDLGRAREVAARISSGLVWVNDAAQADVARTPFAGKKRSGVGSELGVDGLYAYTKVKSLYTALDTDLDARPYSAVGGEWE